MGSPLKSRLSRIREIRTRNSETIAVLKPKARQREGLPFFLNNWLQLSPDVFSRRLVRSNQLPNTLDLGPFFAGLAGSAANPRPVARAEHQATATERLRFFDLETTGLSGGAGTVAFLATVGRLEEEDKGRILRLDQYFLADFPGEASFIEALLAALGPEPFLVSYNGRSFDLPLLRSRCVMNRLSPPRPEFHLDLLFTARRLWRKRFGSVSLSRLESELLGVARGEDVPGSEIPRIWFSFLENGDHESMSAVTSHNAEDVASLVLLLDRASAVFREPRDPNLIEGVDLLNLGRILLSMGRVAEAEEVISQAAQSGSLEACLYHARLLRRSGRIIEARARISTSPSNYHIAMESARLAEKSEGDLGVALSATELALNLATGEEQRQQAHSRARRLRLKIAATSRERPEHRRS